MIVPGWQIAFIVLQVIFTLSLGLFVGLITVGFKEIKALHTRVEDVEKSLVRGDERFININDKLKHIKDALEKD